MDRDATPNYLTDGAFLLSTVRRRAYPGPRWADQRNVVTHYGTLAQARLGSRWALAGGLFRSLTDTVRNHALVLTGLTSDGTAVQRITRDPRQRIQSTSGEARVSRSFSDEDRLHTLHLSYRGRDRRSFYGGGRAIEFGRVDVNHVPRVEEPLFSIGEQTRERVRQHTIGLGYDGRWRGIGSLSLGVKRTDYRKRVERPGAAIAVTHDPAWLYNGTLAIEASTRLAFYGSYTRGIEESGIAPDSAVNRTQALPAILTTQADAGLRWTLPGGMRLVAGLFDVQKPYFAADERNVFAELGVVRHRGAELSMAGSPVDNLTVVAGAVLMRPRVTGEPVEAGRVGRRPVGQTVRLLTFNAQYAVPALQGLTLTFNASHHGDRVADTINLVQVPPQTIIGVGFRHRFELGKTPALLRFQVTNVTNAFDWQVTGSNSYQVNAPRTATLFLTMDL
ncbi:MAG TPA: TonB-dependent receptor [Sphingomicrobium sp.]